jgi:hypothetical protein
MKRRWRSYRCTGLTARWCPLHGTCQCVTINDHGGREWADHMDHDNCPLHNMESKHPAPGRLVTRRRPWLEP